MGFGFLFAGYLLTFSFAYRLYVDLFAVALMMIGLSTLSRYAKGFRIAFFVGLPFLALSAFSFGARIGELLGFFSLSQTLLSALSIGSILFWAVFLWFVFRGVFEISREVEIPVLQAKALRNSIFLCINTAFGLVLETGFFPTVTVFLQVLLAVYLLWFLVYTFLNAKMFFECYVWICLEGDEQMERKESRFGFINRLRAAEDKLDGKTMARRQEEKERKAAKRAERKGQKK